MLLKNHACSSSKIAFESNIKCSFARKQSLYHRRSYRLLSVIAYNIQWQKKLRTQIECNGGHQIFCMWHDDELFVIFVLCIWRECVRVSVALRCVCILHFLSKHQTYIIVQHHAQFGHLQIRSVHSVQHRIYDETNQIPLHTNTHNLVIQTRMKFSVVNAK